MGGLFFDFGAVRTASGPSRRVRETAVAAMASSRDSVAATPSTRCHVGPLRRKCSAQVIGAIVPWNYPFHNVFNPVSAALMAGNGIVVKVSPYASWSAAGYFSAALRECLKAVGAPQDLVQIVRGRVEIKFRAAHAVSVAASARWRGVSRPSTRRCRRDRVGSMAWRLTKVHAIFLRIT